MVSNEEDTRKEAVLVYILFSSLVLDPFYVTGFFFPHILLGGCFYTLIRHVLKTILDFCPFYIHIHVTVYSLNIIVITLQLSPKVRILVLQLTLQET